MTLLRFGDVMPDGRGVPVEGGERRERLGAVALDGKQIVGMIVRSLSRVVCRASRVIRQPRTSTSSSSARVAATSPPSSRQQRLASG